MPFFLINANYSTFYWIAMKDVRLEGIGLSSHLRFAAGPRTHSAAAFTPSIRFPLFKHATGIFKLLF
jgi:hypothetical protein